MEYFNDDISNKLKDSLIYKALKKKCETQGANAEKALKKSLTPVKQCEIDSNVLQIKAFCILSDNFPILTY